MTARKWCNCCAEGVIPLQLFSQSLAGPRLVLLTGRRHRQQKTDSLGRSINRSVWTFFSTHSHVEPAVVRFLNNNIMGYLLYRCMDQSVDLCATYEQDVFVPPGTSLHKSRLHATQLCGYKPTPATGRDMAGTCR